MSFFSGDQIKGKLAASVLLTSPGTPFIYYGEEIGMIGNKPDELIRTPMLWSSDNYAGFSTVYPWGPINRDFAQYNVANESSDPDSLLSLYRNLIQLRNKHAALRIGDFYSVRSDNFSILSYLRVSKEETLLVLINLSEKPVNGFSLAINQGPLSGNYRAYSIYGVDVVEGIETNSAGGFDNYRPIPLIEANGMVIIQLHGR
jgi:glycosidase